MLIFGERIKSDSLSDTILNLAVCVVPEFFDRIVKIEDTLNAN